MGASQFSIYHSQFTVLFSGFLFLVLGFLHRIPKIEEWDTRTFQSIHGRFGRFTGFFRYIWPLGTTPVAVVLITMTFIAGQRVGWGIVIIYTGAAIIERIIKMSLKRERPFKVIDNAQMRQPSPPHDPSHPSGDALRVWFLALVIPTVFGLTWPIYFTACLIAATLSLGRIALGVHYPLDVIGGAGLGLLAASIVQISTH